MKTIAEKSGKGIVSWVVCSLGCLILSVMLIRVATTAPNNQKYVPIIGALIFFVFFVLFLYFIVSEAHRPVELIKHDEDNGKLLVFSKRKWNELAVTDIVDAEFARNHGRSSGDYSWGTLLIKTATEKYTVYNVKDVAEVWANLKHICGKFDS